MHRLQIDIPTPLRQIVSMAHPVTELGAAPANITHFRHLETLLLLFSFRKFSMGLLAPATWVVGQFGFLEYDRPRRTKEATTNTKRASLEVHVVGAYQSRHISAAINRIAPTSKCHD